MRELAYLLKALLRGGFRYWFSHFAKFCLDSQIIGIRVATGLTQREFAERAGIKQPQLVRLETLARLVQVAGLILEIRYTTAGRHRIKTVRSPRVSSRTSVPW